MALYYQAVRTYGDASYYPNPFCAGVSDRAQFLGDLPYAPRRYNGSGPNSCDYQSRVLLDLLANP